MQVVGRGSTKRIPAKRRSGVARDRRSLRATEVPKQPLARAAKTKTAPKSLGGVPETTALAIQLISPARRKMNGVRHLMAAVLSDGVETYCRTAGSQVEKQRRIHEEAAEWIFSDDRWGIFAFVNLCEALDVDAGALREGLARWTRDHTSGKAASNPGLGPIARLLALA